MIRKHQLPDVEPVVLKSFGSMRPGVYILIALIGILVLAFFIVFFLHGLTTNKSYITFKTNLNGIAIYQDGSYLGSTDGSVYRTTSGEHEYSFFYNGIELGSLHHNVKRYYFATFFRRPLQEIEYLFNANSESEAVFTNSFAENIAIWSKHLNYDERYHFPPLYSEFAQNASVLGFKDISSVWLYGAMHITSNTLYEDYLKGKSILDESGIKYMSSELSELEKLIPTLLSESSSSVVKASSNEKIKGKRDGEFFYYTSTALNMGEDTLLRYPETNTYPISLEVPAFGISAVVVSEYEYALFAEENPMWKKSNKDNLIQAGLADENYLNGITLNTNSYSTKPIRNISYYAAEAYCSWLSQKSGKNIVLPTEAEWTVAALSAADQKYTKGLISTSSDLSSPMNMMGQLWEYTSSAYIPHARVSGYKVAENLASEFPYDDIILKGGSYINDESKITTSTVGVSSKNTCSEYVGFRIAVK